jgi:MFS family permease
LINLLLLIAEPGGNAAIFARFLTGAFLAGVYPVGLRIAVSWGNKDRGLLVGALVGALTLGSALPYLFVLLGDANWRAIVGMSSIAAICAGLLCLATKLGPDYARASRFEPGALATAWHNRRVRLAYVGYLGHMWELYAMWAWVAAMAVASYSVTFAAPTAQQWANVTALIAIGIGAPMCVVAGALADRWGKARIAKYSMIASGAFAVATALSFGGPPVVSFVLFILWGATVVPDSALFSALVADAAPTAQTGSLMTLQTALGFALTFLTVQAAPFLASTLGWPVVMTLLALGPVIGVIAMQRLQHID